MFLGIDLAWALGDTRKPPNETGVACIDERGVVLDAGWTRGLEPTLDWIAARAREPSVMAVDAPLVVNNETGQRTCERQVGQRYGRWQVSANTTNLSSRHMARVALLNGLVEAGWSYDDGHAGPRSTGRQVFECYPYTTLVGAPELGYFEDERPRYKRKPKSMPAAEWRPRRARACDELVTRLDGLARADPPASAAITPRHRATARRQRPTGRRGLQARRGPHRRPALRLDGRLVVPARAGQGASTRGRPGCTRQARHDPRPSRRSPATTVTPAELAAELGIDPKALRRWLRATWPPLHPHSRWELDEAQVTAARARFDAPAATGRASTTLPPVVGIEVATTGAAEQDSAWSPWTALLTAMESAPLTPGVYMARPGLDGPVVYVGMAGERQGQGIRGRLAIYVSGKGLVSGLGEAVFDRALADEAWLTERVEEVRAGQPMRAKLWGRAAIAWADLQVRWRSTEDRAAALALEVEVMRALPQEPLWNRYR